MIEAAFRPLWAQLRGHGHLWHRTSLASFEAILRDGEFVPNTGQLHPTYPQSKVSYAWHLRAVFVFDFDTADEPDIFDHELKWAGLLAGVLIRIRRDALDRAKLLLPTEISRDDHRLDSLPDEIRSGADGHSGCRGVAHRPDLCICFQRLYFDQGQPLARGRSDADAFRVLFKVSAEWNADHERLTAERHARGEHSLEDLLLRVEEREKGKQIEQKKNPRP